VTAGAEQAAFGRVATAESAVKETSSTLARRVVLAGIAAYAVIFGGAAVMHFVAFQSARMDLGTMTQTVWATAHGHFMQMTSADGVNIMRFAFHVDPLLALFAPLWWIWPSGVMLVVVQAVAVASGALPVFWLGRKHLRSERAAAHFAFAYLLFPATQFNAFTISTGFHAISLAVPLVLYAIWFLDEERLVPFTVLALLAVATKEEVGAAVGCLGIWYAVRHGKRAAGAAIFVTGTAITLVNFLLVIPHYSPTGASPYERRYTDIGSSPTGILRTAFTDPLAIVHTVATGHKLFYVVLLFGPFLGLWLREPLLFLGAVPDLTINLLSSLNDQTYIAYHWTAGIIPFTVAASVVGAGRIRRNPDQVSLWVLSAAGAVCLFSPIILARGDVEKVFSASPVRAAKTTALAAIPADVPVSASNQLGAYVAARRYAGTFPVIGRAEWAIVDRADPTYTDVAGYRQAIRQLESSPNWSRVLTIRGIEVFRKR
jgi:uncharacterized membrane protein